MLRQAHERDRLEKRLEEKKQKDFGLRPEA